MFGSFNPTRPRAYGFGNCWSLPLPDQSHAYAVFYSSFCRRSLSFSVSLAVPGSWSTWTTTSAIIILSDTGNFVSFRFFFFRFFSPVIVSSQLSFCFCEAADAFSISPPSHALSSFPAPVLSTAISCPNAILRCSQCH